MKLTAAVLSILFVFSACGYQWQNKVNPWEEHNVRSVYVDVTTNDSLTTGVEVPFTSALVKEFARGKKVRVVSKRKDADAIIVGVIGKVDTKVSFTGSVANLSKDKEAETLDNLAVATEYDVSVDLSVKLIRQSDGRILWRQSFGESKLYPGNNRFGDIGSTSVLINESQKVLALAEIADTLAGDVYDSMFEVF